jgi:hypothetical protein
VRLSTIDFQRTPPIALSRTTGKDDPGAQGRWRSSRCRISSSTALGIVVSKSIGVV